MRRAARVSVGAWWALAACSVTPLVYITSQLVMVTDETLGVEYNELECVLDVMLDEYPQADVYLPMLHIVFQKDMPISTVSGGPKRYLGLYYCAKNYTLVWAPDQCLSDTAFIHEMLHFLHEQTVGNCDAGHNDTLYWDEYGPSSWEYYLQTRARAHCCQGRAKEEP